MNDEHIYNNGDSEQENVQENPPISRKTNKKIICTILQDEYNIYLIDSINEDGQAGQLLLECEASYSKSEFKFSIYDAYEYLQNTHFLSFLLAIGGFPTWNPELINIQVHVTNTDKIVIMVETSEIDPTLLKNLQFSSEQRINKTIVTDIPYTPLIITEFRVKGYYSPILVHEISFGINGNVMNFNVMKMETFYNEIIRQYINDAIDTFYPDYREYQKDQFKFPHEKVIRIQFAIEMNSKLAKISIICSPLMYQGDLEYVYSANGSHLISSNYKTGLPNPKYSVLDFISDISSSDVSQTFVISANNRGGIYHNGKSFDLIDCDMFLCTLDRAFPINEIRGSADFREVLSDHPAVLSYWKPFEPILIDKAKTIKLYGFINIDPSNYSSQLFSEIGIEMNEVFGISKKEILKKHLKVKNCYQTNNIYRVGIYEVLNPDTKPEKHKRFWR